MIVICGHPSSGVGRVWINDVRDDNHVYRMEGVIAQPRAESVIVIENKALDCPEWWFEAAEELSH